MKELLAIIIIIGLISCDHSASKGASITRDFGAFTLETPGTWTAIKEKGIDSYVGRIAIDDKDTLSFDLGWYSNQLYEDDPEIWDSSMIGLIDTAMIDTSEVIFVKNRMRVDPDKYRKNNVLWDTIDGRQAKIVYPRRPGVGITGVYIDSLWVAGSDVDRFNLYGVDLMPGNEKKVLEVIRSLKFRKKRH